MNIETNQPRPPRQPLASVGSATRRNMVLSGARRRFDERVGRFSDQPAEVMASESEVQHSPLNKREGRAIKGVAVGALVVGLTVAGLANRENQDTKTGTVNQATINKQVAINEASDTNAAIQAAQQHTAAPQSELGDISRLQHEQAQLNRPPEK